MNPITSVAKVTSFTTKPPWTTTPQTTYIDKRTNYRQKKPYNLNLPYSRWVMECYSFQAGYGQPLIDVNTATSEVGGTAYSHINGFSQNTNFTEANQMVTQVTEIARSKFIGAFQTSVGIGVDLVESRQAMTMIEKRCLQIFDFMRALRKGRIARAADILGVQKHPTYQQLLKDKTVKGQLRVARYKNRIEYNRRMKKRLINERDKAFADTFLEFHFGWEPLVRDVYDSIDLLQQDIPAGKVEASHGGTRSINLSSVSGTVTKKNEHVLKVSVKVGATVKMNNPNLALANQLGLVNPAVLAWEVVPYSFVVDWFINVGDFLGSFTEFAGYTVSDPYTTTKTRDTCILETRDSKGQQFYGTTLAGRAQFRGWSANRVLSLPTVQLKVRSPWRVSPTRAATAISLLIQQGFRK